MVLLGTQPHVLGLGKVFWGNHRARILPALSTPPTPAEKCCSPSISSVLWGPTHRGGKTWREGVGLEISVTSLPPLGMFETSS